MNKSIIALSIALATTLGLAGCESETTTPKADSSANMSASQDVHSSSDKAAAAKLSTLLNAYFDESLVFNPLQGTFIGEYQYNDKFIAPISEKSLAEKRAFESKYLTLINKTDINLLTGQDLLSYQVFKRDREMAIKGYEFSQHLVPFNQMYGIHNDFAVLGSGSSSQPFNTMEDYKNFEKRAQGFADYMDSAIIAMREGIKQGVVLPNVIIKKIIPQLQTHTVADVTTSVFYNPVAALENNNNISAQDKAQLKNSYIKMIEQVIIPSYKKTLDFIVNEYAVHGRDSVGLSALPNGKAWYEYMIAQHTTLPLTSDEIHQYGLQEVARILAEMEKVKQTVGFTGEMSEFFTFLKDDPQFYFEKSEDVIAAYEGVKADINSRLGKLFEVFPKADYQVREVEAFRAASSAGASYEFPAPDGSRPGIFYINTYNLKAQPKFIMETLSIHEASPGHHFQVSIQQEVESLPQFRKFGNYTVYEEGWALYAESLGKELGLFSDPYQWYGRLVDEQLRAMRLVVDTGLHAKGWSREQAMAYMSANSSMADSDVEAEVERYISIPGQALAYKIGQRAIRSMRDNAQQQLGEKFDIKKFHTQVLIDGALPMPILEAKLNRWVAKQ